MDYQHQKASSQIIFLSHPSETATLVIKNSTTKIGVSLK